MEDTTARMCQGNTSVSGITSVLGAWSLAAAVAECTALNRNHFCMHHWLVVTYWEIMRLGILLCSLIVLPSSAERCPAGLWDKDWGAA